MNLLDIATAIANQFVGLTNSDGETVNVPEGGLLQNTYGKGPDLLVFPPEGELELGLNRTVEDVYLFPVRLLFDPIHVPTRHRRLLLWANAMRLKVEEKMRLGLTYVDNARAISMRAEIEGEEYGGLLFDVVEVVIRVRIHEVGATIQP